MFWADFIGSSWRNGLMPFFGDSWSERGGVNRFVIYDLYRLVLPTLLLLR